jgi:hypothetical protein
MWLIRMGRELFGGWDCKRPPLYHIVTNHSVEFIDKGANVPARVAAAGRVTSHQRTEPSSARSAEYGKHLI